MATAVRDPHGAQSIQNAARMIVMLAVGLASIGLVMVHSTSSAQKAATGVDMAFGLFRQALWVALAAGLAVCVATTPLQRLRKMAAVLVWLSLLLLAAVLVVGPELNQARRWLRFGSFGFQPSEMFKVAALLFLADRLAAREPDSSFGARTPLLALLLPMGLGIGLVLLEPDLGTALFLLAEVVVLLGLAGVHPGRVVPYVLVSLPAILIYAYSRFGHVKKRLEAFTGPLEENTQVREALVAIGSGGLLGVGLGRGSQKLHWLLEPHTDFIFAVIGEELGFLGTAGIVLAFMAFIVYGRRIAWAARAWSADDPYPFYVAAGATFLVAFQALVNVAVVTGSAPTKGVSLPFISVGGSNLLMAGACVGLLVNVARQAAAAALDRPPS